MVPQYQQQVQDAEHIKLLVIFHYVMAGLTALAACFPIIHLVMGIGIVSGKFPMPPPSSAGAPPMDMEWMGWMFVIFAGVIIVFGWAMAICLFLAGKMLSERRGQTFVFVIACIQCLSVPLGTALGVFTIIVLQRPSVKALFEQGGAGSPHWKA
jgi:hypothetical protein